MDRATKCRTLYRWMFRWWIVDSELNRLWALYHVAKAHFSFLLCEISYTAILLNFCHFLHQRNLV